MKRGYTVTMKRGETAMVVPSAYDIEDLRSVSERELLDVSGVSRDAFYRAWHGCEVAETTLCRLAWAVNLLRRTK